MFVRLACCRVKNPGFIKKSQSDDFLLDFIGFGFLAVKPDFKKPNLVYFGSISVIRMSTVMYCQHHTSVQNFVSS